MLRPAADAPSRRPGEVAHDVTLKPLAGAAAVLAVLGLLAPIFVYQCAARLAQVINELRAVRAK